MVTGLRFAALFEVVQAFLHVILDLCDFFGDIRFDLEHPFAQSLQAILNQAEIIFQLKLLLHQFHIAGCIDICDIKPVDQFFLVE